MSHPNDSEPRRLPDPPHHLVYIEWRDPTTFYAWRSREEAAAREAAICHSVGWLVHDGKDRVILTMTLSEDEVNGCAAIERGCIVRMKRLPLPAGFK